MSKFSTLAENIDAWGIPAEAVSVENHSAIDSMRTGSESAINEGVCQNYLRSDKAKTHGDESGCLKRSTQKTFNESTLKSLDTTLFWKLVKSTGQKSLFSPDLKVVEAVQTNDADVVTFRFHIEENDLQKTVKIAITAGGLASVDAADAVRNPDRYGLFLVSVDGLIESIDSFGIPINEASYQDMPGSRKRRSRTRPIERIVKRVYDRRKKSGIKPLVDPKKSVIPGFRDFKKG